MVRRAQTGRGVLSNLRRFHDYVKSKKLVSTGLSMAGYKKLGALARQAGYGRRRRAPTAIGRSRGSVVATKSGIVLRAPRRPRVARTKRAIAPRVRAMPVLTTRSRKQRGRGFIGKTLGGIGGGILGGMLPF